MKQCTCSGYRNPKRVGSDVTNPESGGSSDYLDYDEQ